MLKISQPFRKGMQKVAYKSSSVLFGYRTGLYRRHSNPQARNLVRRIKILAMSSDHSSQCNVHEIVTRQAHYGALVNYFCAKLACTCPYSKVAEVCSQRDGHCMRCQSFLQLLKLRLIEHVMCSSLQT